MHPENPIPATNKNECRQHKIKILLPGGAGLVGQNLIPRLKKKGYTNLVVLDKHKKNLAILQKLHPDILAECVDLSESGNWQDHFKDADIVIMLQAHIGGNDYNDFVRNNIISTKLILNSIQYHKVSTLIHVSSSVVESIVHDFYSNTKHEQEKLVLNSGVHSIILRPTLMFGWFDRKHLGWLSRFIKKVPIFPVPGHGHYMRQPLYVGDFCHIIISCIENPVQNKIYNISGLEKIDYIDMIHAIKNSLKLTTPIVRIPYNLFYALLWVWGIFDKNPPFTTQQLSALVADDEFEIIDWPSIFNVQPTLFQKAIEDTFHDPFYSKIILEF